MQSVAMASTPAAGLSWSSSSWFRNQCLTKSMNLEGTKLTDKTSIFTVNAQKKAKRTRKIILKEDVTDLGKKGQLMEVKAGFYRNYLLPMGKAQIVTPLFLKEMKLEEERIEAEKKRVREEAQQLSLMFETVGAFKVKRKGGKGKQIFGSVTAQDLVDIIKAQLQRDVDKRIISLPEIRETGEYIAELKLHPEVTARVDGASNITGNQAGLWKELDIVDGARVRCHIRFSRTADCILPGLPQSLEDNEQIKTVNYLTNF